MGRLGFGANQVDVDFPAFADQPIDRRAFAQQARPAVFERFAEDDLRDVVLPREPQQRLANVRARRGNDLRAELPREREVTREPRLSGFVGRASRVDVRGDPRGLHRRRQPSRVADELFRKRTRADRDEQPVAGLPRAGDGLRAHDVAQVAIDVLDDVAQRHLAQCGKIALLEKPLRRTGRAVAEIDAAFLQPRA